MYIEIEWLVSCEKSKYQPMGKRLVTKIVEITRKDSDPHYMPNLSFWRNTISKKDYFDKGLPESGYIIGDAPTEDSEEQSFEYLQLWIETSQHCKTLYTIFEQAYVYVKNGDGKTFNKITVGNPF